MTDWGYAGLFVGAILAGSVLPFNSETIMAALYVAGLDPWALIFWGTLGNFIGSIINLSIIWNIADTLNALMAIPNLISLLLLSGVMARETKKYLWENRLDEE